MALEGQIEALANAVNAQDKRRGLSVKSEESVAYIGYGKFRDGNAIQAIIMLAESDGKEKEERSDIFNLIKGSNILLESGNTKIASDFAELLEYKAEIVLGSAALRQVPIIVGFNRGITLTFDKAFDTRLLFEVSKSFFRESTQSGLIDEGRIFDSGESDSRELSAIERLKKGSWADKNKLTIIRNDPR